MTELYTQAMKAFLSIFETVPTEFRQMERTAKLQMLNMLITSRHPTGAWHNGNGTIHTLEDHELYALQPVNPEKVTHAILEAQSKICADYLGQLHDAHKITPNEEAEARELMTKARHGTRLDAAKNNDLLQKYTRAQDEQRDIVKGLIIELEAQIKGTATVRYTHQEAMRLLKLDLDARNIKLEDLDLLSAIRAYRDSNQDILITRAKTGLVARIEEAAKLLPRIETAHEAIPDAAKNWHTNTYGPASQETNIYTLACHHTHIWQNHADTLDELGARTLTETQKTLRADYLANWKADSLSPIRTRTKKELAAAQDIQNDIKRHYQKTQELAETLAERLQPPNPES